MTLARRREKLLHRVEDSNGFGGDTNQHRCVSFIHSLQLQEDYTLTSVCGRGKGTWIEWSKSKMFAEKVNQKNKEEGKEAIEEMVIKYKIM